MQMPLNTNLHCHDLSSKKGSKTNNPFKPAIYDKGMMRGTTQRLTCMCKKLYCSPAGGGGREE